MRALIYLIMDLWSIDGFTNLLWIFMVMIDYQWLL